MVTRNALCLVVCLASGRALRAEGPAAEYLSDLLTSRVMYDKQGWGGLGVDTAVRPLDGRKPSPIRIKDKQYAKGLGHHAPGEIVVDLNGEYTAFEADVGILWQQGTTGSVVFQVFVDDQKRFDSGVMKEQDAARPIRVPVEGAGILRLVVTDAGDGITCDCACWADARLIRDPSGKKLPAGEPFDIGPFGRVVTWDPHRNDGAKANRVEEFRTEDVFLERDVVPAGDGTYVVPVANSGVGCIGLQWVEQRLVREVALRFANPGSVPSLEGVQVQYWFGESEWQGAWKPLKATIKAAQDQWRIALNLGENPEIRSVGVQKVRWIFPPSAKPIVVRGLSAFTYSRWDTVDLVIEPDKPKAGQTIRIDSYNGAFVSEGGSSRLCTWDMVGPLRVKVRYSKPAPWNWDRTVLRFGLGGGLGLGVGIKDLLTGDGVYVPAAGVFVARAETGMTLSEYQKKIAGRKTVLQRVREMPDQSFEQAMAKVHNPVQNNGPLMLSLACDNRKFTVPREGGVQFADAADSTVATFVKPRFSCQLGVKFGSGKNEGLARRSEGDWLPITVTEAKDGGLVYRQRTFVVPYGEPIASLTPPWLSEHPLCLAEFSVENPSSDGVEASLLLTFASSAKGGLPVEFRQVPTGTVVQSQGRLLALVDVSQGGTIKGTTDGAGLSLKGAIPGKTGVRWFVYLPGWDMRADDHAMLKGGENLRKDVEAYWKRVMEGAMQVDVPDPLLANVVRASQVHCLMAARNERGGEQVAAWIGSDRYGPLESETHAVILGMDLMGHHDFARRGLEFLIKRYHPAGYLTTGYTVVGTGWHLWTLAEHCRLTRDAAWLKEMAPKVAGVCRWITQQREKTKRLNAFGERVPEYGLVPPGVIADWNRFGYRFFMEGHYYAGLHEAASVLAEIGVPDSKSLLDNAAEFREAILCGYRWAQARAPVVALADGTWVPSCPSMVHCLGPSEEFFPGEDGARSWAGDVEVGPQHLVPLGVLDAAGDEVERIVDRMEDYWFLRTGMGDYPEDKNHADWFNLGGFAKVQPYYGRITAIYAARDDVKPYIRSYFNAIPTLLNGETLYFWEHFHNMGGWNKTHETGGFLQQTRTMLVMERGEELWLAPFVTNNWLKDGMTVSVRNAPTWFGPVSYRIASGVKGGAIEAAIEPPTRTAPKEIVIRLRHPEGKPMQAVTVNGADHKAFDASKECVRIKPTAGTITVRATY